MVMSCRVVVCFVLIAENGAVDPKDINTRLAAGTTTINAGTQGTVGYMSPEIIFDQHHTASAADDVWAIATMLYYMITGQLPFPNCALVPCGKSHPTDIRQVKTAQGRPAVAASPLLEPLTKVVHDALAIDPAHRCVVHDKCHDVIVTVVDDWL